jgi:mono/diheme cytochrome c family protein
MNAPRLFALAVVLSCGAACGGGSQSAPPPETPAPAAPAVLKVQEMKISDASGQGLMLHANGQVELTGKGVVGTVYPDGRLVTADGKEIKVEADGTVSMGTEKLPGKINADGTLSMQNGQTVSIADDGTLTGGAPNAPKITVTGATDPESKKTAMLLVLLTAGTGKPAGPDPAVAAAQKAVDDQVAMGKQLYADKCASCHGDAGEGGGKTPAVVGKEALPLEAPKGAKKRKGVKFQTAMDVLEWTKKNMPMKKPGSLTDDEYAAILAFDLSANGVKLEKKVDFANAAEIKLH